MIITDTMTTIDEKILCSFVGDIRGVRYHSRSAAGGVDSVWAAMRRIQRDIHNGQNCRQGSYGQARRQRPMVTIGVEAQGDNGTTGSNEVQ